MMSSPSSKNTSEMPMSNDTNLCKTCPTFCCRERQFCGNCSCKKDDSWVITSYCYKPGILRNYQDYRRTVVLEDYETDKEYRLLQQKACGIEKPLCSICKDNSHIRWCNKAYDFFCCDCEKKRIY